jgi:hypothetical protein
MLDEVIIAGVFSGIIGVLTLTFKSIKKSECYSKEDCCKFETRSNRNSSNNVIIQAPAIIGQAPAIIEHQPTIIKQDIPEPYPHNESKI